MVEIFFLITSCIQAILQYLKCVKCVFAKEWQTKFNKKRTIYQNPLPPNLFRLISKSSAYGSDNYTSPYFKTNHSIVSYMLAMIISKAHGKLWSLGRFFISPHFILFVFQGLPLSKFEKYTVRYFAKSRNRLISSLEIVIHFGAKTQFLNAIKFQTIPVNPKK